MSYEADCNNMIYLENKLDPSVNKTADNRWVICSHENDRCDQLPTSFVDFMTAFVKDQNANPTGIWADFRCVHASWRALGEFVMSGLMKCEDLPTEPNPSDYPDIDLEATIECAIECCGGIKMTQDGCSCLCKIPGQLGTRCIEFFR